MGSPQSPAITLRSEVNCARSNAPPQASPCALLQPPDPPLLPSPIVLPQIRRSGGPPRQHVARQSPGQYSAARPCQMLRNVISVGVRIWAVGVCLGDLPWSAPVDC